MTNNLENICEPIKNNRNHDDVHLNNQINTANNNDFSNDVEMENGHNITNGKALFISFFIFLFFFFCFSVTKTNEFRSFLFHSMKLQVTVIKMVHQITTASIICHLIQMKTWVSCLCVH